MILKKIYTFFKLENLKLIIKIKLISQNHLILRKKISKMINEKSFLLGNQRYFSTMTDWNPAEIIGLKPKPLSLSLYQSLITDEIWANSR